MLMEDVRKVRTEMDEQSGVGGQIRKSGAKNARGFLRHARERANRLAQS